ncbi:hypothetical protein [Echinicola sediminis]
MTSKVHVLGYLLTLSFALVFTNCNSNGDDTPPCSVAWSTELQAESNAVVAAAQNFGQNPNASTCQAYVVAYQAYLNALDPYGDCGALTNQQRNDWEQAVAEAEASLEDVDCSAYGSQSAAR